MGNLVDCSCDKKSTHRTYYMNPEVAAAQAAIAAGFEPPPSPASSAAAVAGGTRHRHTNGTVNGNVYHDSGSASDFPYNHHHYNHGLMQYNNDLAHHTHEQTGSGGGGNGNNNRKSLKKLMQNNDNGYQSGTRPERKKKRGNAMRRNTNTMQQLDQQEQGWKWGGCDDNVNFGYRKSKQFFDARYRNRSDIKTVLRLHNTEAGRLAVKWNMRMECKCHGLSGSCE